MEFFTHTLIKSLDEKIDYPGDMLLLGSCFSEHIAKKLLHYHFNLTANPTGILFNPQSIAQSLEMFASGTIPQIEKDSDMYFSYDVHSSLSKHSEEEFLDELKRKIEIGRSALLKSRFCIFTLGTAYVYRLKSGHTVANCHKQPSSLFSKELLTVDEISDMFLSLLRSVLKGKEVIFTISPVRHLSDGLQENSLSKATLRVAVDKICRFASNAHYFPSYEIFMDELRDYRFYDTDMIHPAEQGIEYVWEKFKEFAISSNAYGLMEKVHKIMQAAGHHPLHPQSAEYRSFCKEQIAKIDSLSGKVDLSAERDFFLEYTKN
ncbi:MAG: GSCFA domain-containing protein [Alistipes sp.]|nr:GSCFA domain-containing protein [Candidatus Alistipes equi]